MSDNLLILNCLLLQAKKANMKDSFLQQVVNEKEKTYNAWQGVYL